MVVKFGDNYTHEKIGNKGIFLMEMKQKGFPVPDGFILDSDIYSDIITDTQIDGRIRHYLESLNEENISEVSREIQALFDTIEMPKEIREHIRCNIDLNKKYAVRSSGLKEDLEAYSFAGQYDTMLNLQGVSAIEAGIINCYKSMFSEGILAYVRDHNIVNHNVSEEQFHMSIIIQEMIDANYSGIAFSINPVTGNDREMLIEVAKGLGEEIVSGKVKPWQYRYDWYEDKYIYKEKNVPIGQKLLEEMADTFVNIQLFFGYPCDIEFGIAEEQVYILQARPITKIKYSGIQDVWTTANFRDGGVAAKVCTPYMWSLYEYIWETTLRKFVIDSKILKPKECARKLGEMFYGRPYWNLSFVKLVMSNVVGYKEREFDADYGVRITYEGDGETTGITPTSIYKIVKMAIAQRNILKKRNSKAKVLRKDLLNKYNAYRKSYDKIDDIEKCWYQLTSEDYFYSESTYFRQIFINTVHQYLFKDHMLKHVEHGDYFKLLSGIDHISHLRPFYTMWETTRRIRANKEAYNYWMNTSEEIINKALHSEQYYLSDVKAYINKYGYHSNRELDVSYPCFCEDTLSVIKMFKDNVALDDSYSPLEDKQHQKNEYEKTLKNIEQKVSRGKYRKLKCKVTNMRKMLWWREEFKDISTRFYYLIRLYTMKLATYYVEIGLLEKEDDIWMLKVSDLWDYVDGKKTKKELRRIIHQNRIYYETYRNYINDYEIGQVFDGIEMSDEKSGTGIYGLGCNSGVVTARAKVIQGLDDIDRIEQGDILITKFTDTGWTCKFAMLSGIVTEHGGVLCHAAIIAREYGLPCIVCAHDVMKKIEDGSLVTIDGATGEIRRVKEK